MSPRSSVWRYLSVMTPFSGEQRRPCRLIKQLQAYGRIPRMSNWLEAASVAQRQEYNLARQLKRAVDKHVLSAKEVVAAVQTDRSLASGCVPRWFRVCVLEKGKEFNKKWQEQEKTQRCVKRKTVGEKKCKKHAQEEKRREKYKQNKQKPRKYLNQQRVDELICDLRAFGRIPSGHALQTSSLAERQERRLQLRLRLAIDSALLSPKQVAEVVATDHCPRWFRNRALKAFCATDEDGRVSRSSLLIQELQECGRIPRNLHGQEKSFQFRLRRAIDSGLLSPQIVVKALPVDQRRLSHFPCWFLTRVLQPGSLV